MLAHFTASSEKRHEDTQAIIRNQQTTIKNIEQQIGKLSKQFNERLSGTLPGNAGKKSKRSSHPGHYNEKWENCYPSNSY